jgi:hypothetical protein
MTTREQYIAIMKQQLDEINTSITGYESRADRLQTDAEIAYRDGLFRLRQQLTLTENKFEALKASSDSRWDHLVAETERVRDVFVDSFQYFKKHL